MPRGSPLIHSWLVSLGLANDGPSTIATANLWPRSAVAEQLQRIELSLLGDLAFRMPLKTQETILVWTASCVSSCRMPRPCAATPRLVVIAIDLLPEGFGVECRGGTGDAGNDRKRNKGGEDGLHDHSPLTCLIGSLASGSEHSEVIAVDPLVELLSVHCAGSTGDASDYRKCNQGGQDGLHDISPLSFPYPLQCGRG